MPATAARRLLPLLLLAAAAGSVLAIGSALAEMAALDRNVRAIADRADRLQQALADVERAQTTFTRSGSISGPRLEETAGRLREIETGARELAPFLRSTGATPEAADLGQAAEALGAAVTISHENLAAGRDLMAADLLFSGTEEARLRIGRTSRALQTAESMAAEAARTAALVRAWVVFAIAALAGAVHLLLRSRRGRAGRIAEAVTPADAAAEVLIASTSPRTSSPPEHDMTLHPTPATTHAAGAQPAPIDLEAIADLCTAIARMATVTELPDLLARAAKNLRASGVVVWMTMGDALLPVASHGYDEAAASGSLGPVGLDDDNATAAAWRTGRTRVVPAGVGASGAIVAPLHRPDGCAGVLAVELSGGREHDATARAMTTILAAQFAVVLSANPSNTGELASEPTVPLSSAVSSA
jgi:hypothetical protein